MSTKIAIVGMACRYADTKSPAELWENVLAQRRTFRRIPANRLNHQDYISADPNDLDKTYVTQAAVIKNYEFDRLRYRVSGNTYRAADLTHWLALDVAAQALTDAGFADGNGLPRPKVRVVVGNSLAGEFSRANLMRLRWPYVRRVVDAALADEAWQPEKRASFLEKLETVYKRPFEPINAESLAGGLANTIAGRICNHFDLKGGGYTVDGACASSLLAVHAACVALMTHEADVVLAGGVDLSLDPFELVGFAKTGALAEEKMRVYDARSAGFWPGEGCGFVVLMRGEDALAHKRLIYAFIRGWGVSSDGAGGITRPETEGQVLALQQAYQQAGFSPGSVSYFEGHGTGTAVGDAVELQTLIQTRAQGLLEAPFAVVGSIKANIGHTKAAAGLALAPCGCPPVFPGIVGIDIRGCRGCRRGEVADGDADVGERARCDALFQFGAPVVLGVTAPGEDGALPAEGIDAELGVIDAGGVERLGGRVDALDGAAEALEVAPVVWGVDGLLPEPDVAGACGAGEEGGKEHVVEEHAVLVLLVALGGAGVLRFHEAGLGQDDGLADAEGAEFGHRVGGEDIGRPMADGELGAAIDVSVDLEDVVAGEFAQEAIAVTGAGAVEAAEALDREVPGEKALEFW